MRVFTKKKEDELIGSSYNSPKENELIPKIDTAQLYAESGKRVDIEKEWTAEGKIYIGKQWDTTKGVRSKAGKKRNFNSQDNLVLPMVKNIHDHLTTTTPESEIEEVETEDKEAVQMLNDLVPFILRRNKFRQQWKKIVLQMIKYGPVIGYVYFDQHWKGGSGPNKWVGEIKTVYLKKNEFFPDPAILDLEERLQECSYINLKLRKKLQWLADTWEKGKHVIESTDDIEKNLQNEGPDPQQATLIYHFHKGVPEFITEEWKKTFLEKAEDAEAEGLPYKAKDFRDMAIGALKGVHCAYKAGSVLLDYIPYIYEDGLYPFVYKVMYADEDQPWGMGEIRNVVSPQILHNRADEIELGAMLGQGLGGGFYQKGALSISQRREMLDNIPKANAWTEVDNVHLIVPRPTSQIPAYITNYKDSKKVMIDNISQNTDISKGISPGANVPYSTVAALGARADIRSKGKIEVLEDFYEEFLQLIINRIVQFYTQDRTYRIFGDRQQSLVEGKAFETLQDISNMPPGTPPEVQIQAIIELLMFIKTQQQKPKTGTFNKKMLVRTWDRDKDENGEPMKEEFIPEYDLKVKVMDERPTDRSYWTSVVSQARGAGLIGPEAYWDTIIDGKIPTKKTIMEELAKIQKAQAEQQQAAIQQQQQQDMMATQTGLQKQQMQNASVEKQVAMKVMSKEGGNARR